MAIYRALEPDLDHCVVRVARHEIAVDERDGNRLIGEDDFGAGLKLSTEGN